MWKTFHNYLISDEGDVKRKDGYIMKPFETPDGHWRIGLTYNGKQTKHTIHRLVALLFIPNPNNLSEVHHIDGNPKNNEVSNLMWISREDHNKIHNKSYKGEDNGNSKVTEEDVIKIRQLKKDGARRKDVYEMYSHKLAFGGFRSIWEYRTWKHIT